VHELVAGERVDHEQREVDAPRPVAGEDGVADVAALPLGGKTARAMLNF
jgi:hypothetical protein